MRSATIRRGQGAPDGLPPLPLRPHTTTLDDLLSETISNA